MKRNGFRTRESRLGTLLKPILAYPGKAVAERLLLDGCGGSCSYKCTKTLSVCDRNHLFEVYWSLGDHSRQISYISGCVEVKSTKGTYVKGHESRRKNSNVYKFTLITEDGEKCVHVCKKTFTDTLGISHSHVERILEKGK